uniref:Uncharacterized protein n=1 Tax=Anguilla anguilla TaxID=7936 RepID=A0A0E9UY13_ANGAN
MHCKRARKIPKSVAAQCLKTCKKSFTSQTPVRRMRTELHSVAVNYKSVRFLTGPD